MKGTEVTVGQLRLSLHIETDKAMLPDEMEDVLFSLKGNGWTVDEVSLGGVFEPYIVLLFDDPEKCTGREVSRAMRKLLDVLGRAQA